MRPELYLMASFFVLLWYGSYDVVTPVTELCTLISTHSKKNTLGKENEEVMVPMRGPTHASSALTRWTVGLFLLSALIFFRVPVESLCLGGSFQKDTYSLLLISFLFVRAALILRVSLHWQKVALITDPEYVYLAFLSVFGGRLLIQSVDLMSMYLCLELQSFSLVVLCGLNSKSAYSLEAAMKYFLLSAFRSCLLLLGMSFLYWHTGETNLRAMTALVSRSHDSLFLLLGIWLVSLGLLWKLGAAPLHFWVPDVLTGRWTSVSLWISILPKIRVLAFWTHRWHRLWTLTFGKRLIFFRMVSLVLGSLAPLGQTQLKRLLRFSSIGHMGLLLMPLCSGATEGISALWRHMFLYTIVNVGVWGLLQWPLVRPDQLNDPTNPAKGQGPQYLWDLQGLAASSPSAALRWTVFMVSLAGLPPMYGFLGKVALLWSRVKSGLYATVALALLRTLLGSVYYLKVVKVCYVEKAGSWASYGKLSSSTAYILATCVAFMAVGLWHGNALFLATHLLSIHLSSFF